jgi:hypothetical protein
MAEVYRYKNNEWIIISYACKFCERVFKQERYWTKHEEDCKRINTIKRIKSGEDMLIQRITKGDQSFFRRGNDGKLYKTREEAESNTTSMKKKGADGKACWEGYRYAGTKDGKDRCVKVKGR